MGSLLCVSERESRPNRHMVLATVETGFARTEVEVLVQTCRKSVATSLGNFGRVVWTRIRTSHLLENSSEAERLDIRQLQASCMTSELGGTWQTWPGSPAQHSLKLSLCLIVVPSLSTITCFINCTKLLQRAGSLPISCTLMRNGGGIVAVKATRTANVFIKNIKKLRKDNP